MIIKAQNKDPGGNYVCATLENYRPQKKVNIVYVVYLGVFTYLANLLLLFYTESGKLYNARNIKSPH